MFYLKVLYTSSKWWYKHGKLHRLTGPAFICYKENGKIIDKEYWIEGIILTKEQWETEANRINLLTEII